jgi:3-hydroxyisobutyrate dehydrogenase-like beta-hydroxyacid dehydrogenase
MGYGMASNIRQKMPSSSVLFIVDVYRPVCDKFIAEFSRFGRIEIAQSVKEATANAKVIISSLPSITDVCKVYLDEDDGCIAAPADPDRLILECSTIESSSAREIANKLTAAKSGFYVDTPASVCCDERTISSPNNDRSQGGSPAAAGGKLSFMIGHTKPEQPDSISVQIQRVLEMMGEASKLFWCGRVGAGLAAKISNNYVACSVFLIVAEALAIGVRSGIDPKLLQQVIHNSSGQTFMGDIIASVPKDKLLGRNGFPINLMIKDLGLGVGVANEIGVTPRMALGALSIWKEAAEDPDILNTDGFF